MRKLREILFYAFLIVPAVGIVIGVQYATKNKHGGSTAVVSEVDGDDSHASRTVARTDQKDKKEHGAHDSDEVDGNGDAVPGHGNKKSAKAEKVTKHAAPSGHASAAHETPVEAQAENKTVSKTEAPLALGKGETEKAAAGVCISVEYAGDSPQHIAIDKSRWTMVMDAFHEIKDDYLKWLNTHKESFSKEQFATLEARVKFTRIQRPPSADEPDLSWRGFAAWSLDGSNEPLIKIGGGFLELTQKEPKRAKFELARMVAQAWAPCELKRLGVGEMWAGVTSCLKVEGADACTSGSYSEAAWAVGSALAVQVAAPGCTVPAFAPAEMAGCVQKIVPFKTTAATAATPNWKEARR